MNEQKSSEIQMYGFDLVKILHIIVQVIFIPVAAGCLQHNFQILVPLPIGIFILLSIFCNFVVYIPHLLEHRLNFGISKSTTGVTIETTKFWKRRSTSYDFSKDTKVPTQLHESLGWVFVFMLGFAWNFYLMSEGIKLLSVKAFFQGLPMFFYGFFTGLFYLLMWILPDREILLRNYEIPKKFTLLLIPFVTVSFRLKKIIFGKKWINKLEEMLGLEPNLDRKDFLSFLKDNWVQIFQLCTWFIVWIFGATFFFDFYHYQYVAAFVFIVLMYYVRKIIFKKTASLSNSWWIYPFWALAFHEVGIKAWHVTALGVLSPSSIIWTLPVSWILFALVLTSTVLEILKIPILKGSKNGKWIIVWVILLVELGLQFTALFSTTRIIPFYFSFIEIGPII